MKITNIEIQNYRLLLNEAIDLEDDITLIVGRNNSGKSSLADLFIDLLEKKKPNLCFFDFSNDCYPAFKKALEYYRDYQKSKEDKEDEKVQISKKKLAENTVPKIELRLLIEYKKDEKNEKGEIIKNGDNLAALSKFIMDLDVGRNEAYICIEYSSDNVVKLYENFEEYAKENKIAQLDEYKFLLKFLEDNIQEYYSIKMYEVDKNKPDYKQLIESRSLLDNVFYTRSIVAQRSVDDNSSDNKKALGGGFERYYKHTKPTGSTKDDIKKALDKASVELEKEYEGLFNGVLTELQNFGAETPTKIPNITIKSILNSENVLKDNIRYFYKNSDDVHFPENYNGLGYSNLIFMLLQFASFFEEFKNSTPKPNFLFLILEEPEAHMHPQMQQVFIKSVNDFLKGKGECVQLVITTHSSHILAESGIDEEKGFDRIRYFDNSEGKLKIRNLSKLVIDSDKDVTIKFLRQYLTLQKCDVFFADKVILVEGTTERMLLPLMIKKISKSLQHQYISIIEVGGAYAQKFKELLEFINVKTLIITDLDSVTIVTNGTRTTHQKCKTKTYGCCTSNETLKTWIPQKVSIADLLAVKKDEKLSGKNKIGVVYQLPENEGFSCGRSFEEAFILKNKQLLKNKKKEISLLKKIEDRDIDNDDNIYDLTSTMDSKKKTEFAFDLLILNNWEIPKYIEEGLKWLEEKDETMACLIKTLELIRQKKFLASKR